MKQSAPLNDDLDQSYNTEVIVATLPAMSTEPQADTDDQSPGTIDRAGRVLRKAVNHLLAIQQADGHWCGELEGDSILQSEYLLLKWILGHEDDPRLPRIGNTLRKQQLDDGSWRQYPGASKVDLSATVKGYFALKLLGDSPDDTHMTKARAVIREHGGAECCNSFTKFYLAALGQISYSALPSIPPQIVFLPKWAPFHIDKISAWSRTMILPLSIVTTYRPARRLDPDQGIDELYLDDRKRHQLQQTNDISHTFWTPFFKLADGMLKSLSALQIRPLRHRSVKWIERWLIERLERTEGLGAIFPPMVYIQVALRCLGYPDDHPLLVKARKDLDDLMLEDESTGDIRLQPCFSPVWDTGIAAYALTDAGLDRRHPMMRKTSDWLVGRECRQYADWANNVPSPVKPSGWYFEYRNEHYPDVDDTVMVSMALHRIGGDQAESAARRGVQWSLAMQNDDGGWAAFDRTRDRRFMEFIPFADHNAIQDPSCPDITGRTLECLGYHGFTTDHPVVKRAIRFIRNSQMPEGCWFGRWGVNYIYGTWQVVCGLKNVGCDMNSPWIQAAGEWLKSHQKENGSFGESADTYEDESLQGRGPSTASQTAWATMAMMAVYGHEDASVERGIQWLLNTQLPSGTWDESWFTGTGFPRVFYLRYHLYRLYFPVMAIGRWLRACDRLPTY